MKFYGELLIFILLFVTNARVLFLKKAKRDSLVILAPLSVLLSVLFILAWGIELFTIAALIISLLVLVSNFHAMFRYSERLYVDHYSPLMYIWSFITIILSAAAIVTLIIFHPVELDSASLNVKETKTRLHGSFRTGFEHVSNFGIANANIYEFSPENDETAPIVLFIPDKQADTYYYKPYLQFLAQNGYTVLSGDFFASDCKWIHTIEDLKISRRFFMVIRSMVKNQWFMLQREYYTYNISLELKAMTTYISEKYGPDHQIFLISDVMGNTACDDFIIKNPGKISGSIKLSAFPEYETPGYGFIAQTDPLLAFYKKIDRDDDCFKVMKVANKSANLIKETLGVTSDDAE